MNVSIEAALAHAPHISKLFRVLINSGVIRLLESKSLRDIVSLAQLLGELDDGTRFFFRHDSLQFWKRVLPVSPMILMMRLFYIERGK